MRLHINPDGTAVELAPEQCPAGHRLGPGQVIVGWLSCTCTSGTLGHRTWTCATCHRVQYDPPHSS
jgi:hypothetical protein